MSKKKIQIPQNKKKTSIVIANGPSLNEQLENDIAVFKNNTCYCSNYFARSEYFPIIRPEHYVFLDNVFWTEVSERNKNLYNKLKEVSWKINIYFPQFANLDYWLADLTLNSNITIIRYNYVYYKGFEKVGNFLFNKKLATPRAQTVTIISLYLSLLAGSKKIYLCGADQTWHENVEMIDNKIYSKVVHFYENKNEVKSKLIQRKELDFNSRTFFWILYQTFVGYNRISLFADSKNAKIINTSKVSFIDVFDKGDLIELNIK